MTGSKLSDARAELVRRRVLDGAAEVLGRGEALTYAAVAAAGGVPERTLYRYFPTREALLSALFDSTNEKLGFEGELPVDAAGLAALVRRAFPAFDALAPVVRELLIAPEGRRARLANKPARQRASLAAVRRELDASDATNARRIAALLQLLTAASTWQTLRDYWDMDGTEAAETAALGIELVLDGARARAKRTKRKRSSPRSTRAAGKASS